MKEHDDIQKAHWNTKPLSNIFTAFVWSKSENFSFALSSLDVTHDKFVVDFALKIIFNHIETILPNVEEVNCFSDGAGSQFKQRFHFRNLTRLANERKINLSWHFFATSHRKGVVDEIGGTVKRLVWSAILAWWAVDQLKILLHLQRKRSRTSFWSKSREKILIARKLNLKIFSEQQNLYQRH